MSSNWCTIESDPGVFTELLSDIGVRGVQVEELHSLDDSTFTLYKPILGLIFLFKYVQTSSSDEQRAVDEDNESGVFFAKQVINNACGTQALFNILMNCNNVELGSELSNFKEFTSALDSESRGWAIGESELIRSTHNSYARPEPFIFDEKKQKDDEEEDAFHFIGYVPVNGLVYELDGLQAGPILVGAYDIDIPDSWLSVARDAIQERIEKYAAKEIRFNLMALVKQHKLVYEEQLQQVQQTITAIQNKLTGNNMQIDTNTTTQQQQQSLPDNETQLRTLLHENENKLHELRDHISDEDRKLQRYKTENIRRKHNYLPFIYNLLRGLAERDQLESLVEQASKKAQERRERQKQRKIAEQQNNTNLRKDTAIQQSTDSAQKDVK